MSGTPATCRVWVFATRHSVWPSVTDVGGFVRNLRDGRVELVAEGEPAEVEAFLSDVARSMAGYITHQEQRDETPEGLTHFRIAY
jgi:acylphosphatase